LGLAVRYDPSELRLYLIDGKEGVELAPYRHLPHTEVVSLHSTPELSRSILTELLAEKERRNSLFKQVGVNDFQSYRQTGAKLPRILLLVDEYQELFEGDRDGIASSHLLTLAQQGRSAGIHMLLASQSFGAAGMLKQTAIFGNIHLRMGMKMSHSDIQALTEFGKKGKSLLMTCDLPGKIVINDASGDDNGNTVGKVAFLDSEQRDRLIEKIAAKSRQLPAEEVPETIVFDGNAQPNAIENPQLRHLLEQHRWLTPAEWETLARQPITQGGLQVNDWYSAEHPKVMWLGQQFSVRQQATMIVRRRRGENALIVGGDFNTARYGMLAAILSSLALNQEPKALRFIIVDRSLPGTQWHQALEQVWEYVLRPAGFVSVFTRENQNAAQIIDNLVNELDRRIQMTETALLDEPSLFVMMTELDRVDELCQSDDGYYGSLSPLGEKLKRLYVEGSAKGIHLILSFSGVKSMAKVVDIKRGLPNFRHRVALQISEDDSFTFVRDRSASRLQSEGSVPIRALYMDMDSDRSVEFKPYSTEATINFSEQIQEIGSHISKWNHKS
jgi:DNA segregation ATPase FtsK/SpoIIIE, S-DNA-T family